MSHTAVMKVCLNDVSVLQLKWTSCRSRSNLRIRLFAPSATINKSHSSSLPSDRTIKTLPFSSSFADLTAQFQWISINDGTFLRRISLKNVRYGYSIEVTVGVKISYNYFNRISSMGWIQLWLTQPVLTPTVEKILCLFLARFEEQEKWTKLYIFISGPFVG